jgi:hypothetical protein
MGVTHSRLSLRESSVLISLPTLHRRYFRGAKGDFNESHIPSITRQFKHWSRLLPFMVWCLLLGPMAGGLSIAAVPATVVDVQGESHAGSLTGLTAAEITLSINKQPRIFPARDVLELRFDHKRINPDLWGAVIFLANGDRLAASPESFDDAAATVRWTLFPGWKSTRIPLETVAGFILEVPEISAVRSLALRTVMDRRQKSDVVDLKNGDQASGEFLGLTEKTLRLETSVGETAIDRDSIRLVTMNRELISFPAGRRKLT